MQPKSKNVPRAPLPKRDSSTIPVCHISLLLAPRQSTSSTKPMVKKPTYPTVIHPISPALSPKVAKAISPPKRIPIPPARGKALRCILRQSRGTSTAPIWVAIRMLIGVSKRVIPYASPQAIHILISFSASKKELHRKFPCVCNSFI